MEINPPPHPVPDFSLPWRNWLNQVYEKLRGPLWEDMLAPLAPGKAGAGTPGGPTDINGGPYEAWTFVAGDTINVAFHIPHDIKPGSKMYPHVHWTTNGTENGTTTWKIHHQIAKGYNQEAFPTATVITMAASATSGTAWQHMITEVTDAQAIDAPEVDSLILVGVELDATTLSTDAIFGIYVDIHYQKDRFGTPQRNGPDFYSR